ncbi:NRDE family protein [Cognatitamlana onchidii]|uniref:NRDE family protein n=1 Tax=Cognatitamlana onchidii TaxID=2562860 RepID=UPI0010A60411|nr:NRDE family protein [Algibacter onchidii]
MCTLTFIPGKNNNFIITQNRDEAPNREALLPSYYNIDGIRVLYPKDELSGGTWIGISEKNRVVCVLNGGFVKHQRKASYKKSRGLVANDFMVCEDIEMTIEEYDFNNIEPFTLVVADWSGGLKLYELVWDGLKKYFSELPLTPRIWSSSTLYTEAMKEERKKWFRNFVLAGRKESTNILKFHKSAGADNIEYGVIMDRGFVKTTSITQIVKHDNLLDMHYIHLDSGCSRSKNFLTSHIVNG